MPDGLAAYTPEFKSAENASWDTIENFGKKTTTADPLLAASLRPKLTEALEHYQRAPEKVAIVGRTGHGKSTLLSALLGNPGVAMTVNAGPSLSCTVLLCN
jgi:ABC-type transport system involved in cytochrome bd biosynthesis fused ATPase/permease subunit